MMHAKSANADDCYIITLSADCFISDLIDREGTTFFAFYVVHALKEAKDQNDPNHSRLFHER